MEWLDGVYDYNFALRRGKRIHYYEVIAESREAAINKAKKNFKKEYGDRLFMKIIVEENVSGYPLTKM